MMTPLERSMLRNEAVRIARNQVGYGEHYKKFLPAIGAGPNDEWCAILIAWCYTMAAVDLNLPMPSWAHRGMKGNKYLPERGAKRLTKNLGKVGSIWRPFECDADRPKLGDLACWNRGVLGWTGHVGIITSVGRADFYTVEGNVRGRVVERPHSFAEPRLYRFASLEPADE